MTVHLLVLQVLLLAGAQTTGQSARDIEGAAGVVPLVTEPPPLLVVDPPLPEPLSAGRVVIQYHAFNLRIEPVFGPEALHVTPRVGHIHVTVDGLPWHWADASGEPVILNGMQPGPHKVLIQLVNANNHPFTGKMVEFVIPPQPAEAPPHTQGAAAQRKLQ